MAPAACRTFLRAILTAAAISCTLSIPRDQGKQRLTQIKDMICVLILSGMQKEDLEVSMLRKLQRYSVNIDDMNNEQHRQECLSKNKDFTSETIVKNNDNYFPSTVRATTAIDDPLRDLSMTAVLNYLKNKQSKKVEKTTTSLDLQQEMDTRATEYFMNRTKSNINLLQRYIELENLNSSMYEVNHTYKTTSNNYTNQNINIEVDEIKTKGVKDNEFINTIFKDYLIQTKILPTTTEAAITRGMINIQNVYKRIEELISGSNVDNKNANEKLLNNISKENQYFISSTGRGLPQDQTTFNRESQIKNFYDFLSTVNQFKSYSSIVSPQNNPTAYAINTKKYVEKNIISTSPKQEKYEKIISNEPEIDTGNRKAISSDFVKEIAKSVKDVIIKDLRDELSNIYREPVKTTTVITTTTTTETSSTTASKIITKDKEFAIMDTFMELYEQIKALKHNTFALEAQNKSVTTANDFIQESKIIVRNPPVVNYYELQKPENKISMSSDYNTRHSNINPYHTRQINNLHVPLTIQTNSVEIQPLAIPVFKPESLINQNIVVNSRHVQHRNNHARHYIPRKNRFSDIRIIHRNRTHKYSPVKQPEVHNVPRNQIRTDYEELRHDDVIRFRMKNHGNAKIDTDYYEKINFGDNYKSGDNVHNVDFGNRNIPRFHERLERIDDRFAALSDKDIDYKGRHHNDDVPERQQLSLIDMKKGTSYDDTHFKNFLKTQQKVTDILERILATRPKTNTPRSVETT